MTNISTAKQRRLEQRSRFSSPQVASSYTLSLQPESPDEQEKRARDAGHTLDGTHFKRSRSRLSRVENVGELDIDLLTLEPRSATNTPTLSTSTFSTLASSPPSTREPSSLLPAPLRIKRKSKPSRSPSPFPPMVPSKPVRLLVASLGNPAPYTTTRHSAGHVLLKTLASHLNFDSFQKNKAYTGSISQNAMLPEYVLWQSGSLMNISGVGLLKAWKEFSKPTSLGNDMPGLVILHDEMETAPGVLKIRRGAEGSARGHNGIKSVLNSLRGAGVLPGLSDRLVKVGIGIGRPDSRERDVVSAYVLGQITKVERDGIEGRVGELEGVLKEEVRRMGSL